MDLTRQRTRQFGGGVHGRGLRLLGGLNRERKEVRQDETTEEEKQKANNLTGILRELRSVKIKIL